MRTRLQAVRVQEVILNGDTNPERYELLGGHDAVGIILYTKINEVLPTNGSTDRMSFAKPLFSSITQYPLVNEIVYLVRGPSTSYPNNNTIRNYYIPAIKIQNHPNQNILPDVVFSDKNNLPNDEIEGGATNLEEEEFTVNLGEYFTESEDVRPLRPYEGDTIIEGRYGNTIRLGATTPQNLAYPETHTSGKIGNRWSNGGEVGNPITIIRNGQMEDLGGESFEHILEDIDNDNSSIYLCSNQRLTDFIPASPYQISFGERAEPETVIEPEPIDEPITEDTEEDIVVSPPPLPPEPEEEPAESQVIFPGEDLGDLSYANPEEIDLEMPFGSQDAPPLHEDALETWGGIPYLNDPVPPSHLLGPYGFYNTETGFDNQITLKDKDMNTILTWDKSSGSPSELLTEAKASIGNGI